MDFDLSEDQREIQQTARALLAARSDAAVVRAAAEAHDTVEALWGEVCGLGWAGIAVALEHEGQGLGLVELCVVLEQAGAALAPIPLLSTAAAALAIDCAGSPEQRERWLGALATGAARGGFGLRVPGHNLIAGATKADVSVVFEPDGGRLIELGDAQASAIASIDPLRDYAELWGRGEKLTGDVEMASRRVAVALAAESVGVCQRALEITLEYVKERRQFDTPVGAFQAVAHRCAEMLLHTEGARSTVYRAAWAADASPEQLPEAAALAKAVSSEAVVSVTGSAIQAHGGIGFTWEADVHWLYKRAQMNAQLMGGSARHREYLAEILGLRSPA